MTLHHLAHPGVLFVLDGPGRLVDKGSISGIGRLRLVAVAAAVAAETERQKLYGGG